MLHEGTEEQKEEPKEIEKRDWTFKMNITTNENEHINANNGEIKYETGLVLFKLHDLRLRDHEAIFQANVCCHNVI